jgi:excisionase family DNA binding protein
MPKEFYSTSEVAQILHMSRVGVFKRIRNGKIKGEKIGRNYVVSHESLMEALGRSLGKEKKENIEKAVDKAMREYEKTFKLLGKE